MKETSALAALDAATAVAPAKLDVVITMKKTIPGRGLADSIVYALGRLHDAQTVTGDQHFQDLANVFFIKG